MARKWTQIALLIAISFLGNILAIKLLPQGGDLSLYPILLIFICIRFGIKTAMITLIITQILLLLMGLSYVLGLLQWLLDYILANVALIIPFHIWKNKYLSYCLGFFLKYVVHVISGILFFGSYTEGNLLLYSLIYNLMYLLPTLVVNLLILWAFFKKYKFIFKS